MNKGWETPKELADRVGVSVSLIRGMIKRKELDHIYPTPSRKHARIPSGAWEKSFGITSSSLKPSYQDPKSSYWTSSKRSLRLRLLTLRKDLAMSQEEFSVSISCSRSAYQHYERGERDVPASTIANVAIVHNVDLYWLLLEETKDDSSNKGADE